MDLFLEDFEIATVIQEVADTARPLIEKGGNQFELDVPPDAGLMRADLVKVRQSLLNLLSNAAKFTERGAIRLEVRREEVSGRVLFSVVDSGIGMSETTLQRLFEPFQQADAETTRRYGGTGLGLALTRSFAQLMAGDVQVQSRLGEGSRFTLDLPLRVPAPRLAPETSSPPTPGEGRRGTILVVDDDPSARDLLSRMLTREGYRVETAADGDEGLRRARELRPTAVTLDIMMPHRDGWSVLSELRDDPATRDIPVIVLTMIDERNLGYALGASDYLTKPVDRERLGAALRRFECANPPCPLLIVDDDADQRRILRPLLEAQGWDVAEAGDGEEALARMQQRLPEVILLDLMMPGMDGFAFAALLRRNTEWAQIPIIVLTAKDLTADDRARLEGHVNNVLQKGVFSRDELLQLIRREIVACAVRGAPASPLPA